MRNRFVLLLLGAIALLVSGVAASTALAGGEGHTPVTICHMPGTPAEMTLVVDDDAVEGHLGHGDYLGQCQNMPPDECEDQYGYQDSEDECEPPPIDYCDTLPGVQAEDEDCPPPPPVDVCRNLEGNQSELPPGYHFSEDSYGRTICVPNDKPVTAGVTFSEATCTSGPSFQLMKTIPGLPFYDVEGPLVNGQPVPGGTYTITALPDEGYVVVGQSVFVHTFAAAPTNCGGTTLPTGTASVSCDSGSNLYRTSGTIDGQTADSVTPSTIPGSTKGTTSVAVKRGDETFLTSVTTSGDCGTPPTVTPAAAVAPAAVATPATPAAPKPPAAAKPKPKPVVKPKPKKPAKAKPKPKKPAKAKPHKKPHKAPKTL